MATKTTLILCFIAATFAIEPPIPMLKNTPGTVYNGGLDSAPLKLEAFVELNCPDSLAAWPVLKAVADHYGADRLQLTVHQMPLPYHRNAFISTQGFHAIQQIDSSQQWAYMEKILENYRNFSTSNTQDKTEHEVISMLSLMATEATAVDRTAFENALSDHRTAAVLNWKFATRRGVAGTPWFFVNGIDLAVNPSRRLTEQEWRDFLDPLLEVATSTTPVSGTGNRMDAYRLLIRSGVLPACVVYQLLSTVTPSP